MKRNGERLPQVDPGQLSAEQQVVFERIAGTRGRVAGPFTVLLHVPELADRIQQLGAYLRFETELERDLAEAAVLVIARVWACPFEWEAHQPIARRAGVPAEVIDAIGQGGPYGSLPERYRAVCDLADQLASSGDVSDDAYQAVAGLLSARSTVELTVLVGYYTLLAFVINAHQIPSPPAAEGAAAPWQQSD